MELMTVLFSCARLNPIEPRWSDRDRIVVSHGHTSPGVYSALASAGFFPSEEFEAHFRQARSVFEGHVERAVPGVEWSSGNLGQGLSAGVGMALGARLTDSAWRTYVLMSDGEQHKGQVAEARRLAVKEGLTDLMALVDLNGIQISGRTAEVMPVPVAEDFAADGWRVVYVDGHDIEAIHGALVEAEASPVAPTAIIAKTVIGKGVSFMENDPEFHGRGLTDEEYVAAMAELGLPSQLAEARVRRAAPGTVPSLDHRTPTLAVETGVPREYSADTLTDCRSAWGTALTDIAGLNTGVPVAVLDCDLAVSVKTDAFAARNPEGFIQCGVGEHNTAVVGGALSTTGVLTYWADFGVFGLDEVYNQQRLNDINGAALKLVLTHCGIDVGEDGKTHQCLDYVGAFRNLFGWRVIVPADPNQTDRAVRAMSTAQGCVALAMGRSKLSTILAADGTPVFAGDYEFRFGETAWVRDGADGMILTMGTPSGAAVAAADALAVEGVALTVGVVSTPLELDAETLLRSSQAPWVLVVEDHHRETGLWASCAQGMAAFSGGGRLESLGVGGYQSSGGAEELRRLIGLDTDGISAAARQLAREGRRPGA
jgi:transketolase